MFLFLITGINTKHLANALQLQTIDVIKDFNLENGDGKDDPELKHLELFHLVIYLKLQKKKKIRKITENFFFAGWSFWSRRH